MGSIREGHSRGVLRVILGHNWEDVKGSNKIM